MIERLEQPDARAPYDTIAADYASIAQKSPLNKFGVYPSFYEAIGDVRGKDIIDFACGTGFVTRDLKLRGARRVIGVDLSREMLAIARSEDNIKPLGIEYVQGRVGALGKIGDFDIVTGGWLLHYAASKEELARMCRDVSDNLKSDGMFVAINNNPHNPLADDPKYEVRTVPIGDFKEGCELEVTYTVGETVVSFRQHYWKQDTYEEALRDAGLNDVEWLPIHPTGEGRKVMGRDFWDTFLANPNSSYVQRKKSAGIEI